MMNNEALVRCGKAQFLQAVINGCTLKDLICLAEEIIEKPFALVMNNHLVWYVSNDLPNNPIIPKTGGATIDAQSLVISKLSHRLFDNNTSCLVESYQNYHYCFCPLRSENKFRGYSCMIGIQPFSDSEIQLLKAFCDIMFEELEKQETAKRVLLLSEDEELLMRMLEDPNHSYGTQDVKAIFAEDTQYLEALVVQCRLGTEGFAPDLWTADALQRLLNCDICFGYHSSIVSFLPFGNAERAKEKLEQFARDHDLIIGISNPFSLNKSFSAYYEQAIRTLAYCKKWERSVLHYSEIVLFDLLDQIPDSINGRLLCNLDILDLESYDKMHGTDFCRTLRVYIETGFNAIKTAKILGLHRNSVLARMDKIQTLVDERKMDMDALISLLILEHKNNSSQIN